MSGYTQQDNYWGSPSGQNQYNFDSSGFGQPNQQFDFANYNDQQSADYSSYPQQDYLNPNQSAYTGDLYTPDNFNQGSPGFIDEENEPPHARAHTELASSDVIACAICHANSLDAAALV